MTGRYPTTAFHTMTLLVHKCAEMLVISMPCGYISVIPDQQWLGVLGAVEQFGSLTGQQTGLGNGCLRSTQYGPPLNEDLVNVQRAQLQSLLSCCKLGGYHNWSEVGCTVKKYMSDGVLPVQTTQTRLLFSFCSSLLRTIEGQQCQSHYFFCSTLLNIRQYNMAIY